MIEALYWAALVVLAMLLWAQYAKMREARVSQQLRGMYRAYLKTLKAGDVSESEVDAFMHKHNLLD